MNNIEIKDFRTNKNIRRVLIVKKNYYQDVSEKFEGAETKSNATIYNLMAIDTEDIVSEFSISGTIRVEKDKYKDITEYIYEDECGENWYNKVALEDFYIVSLSELPEWFMRLVSEFDGAIEEYSEEAEENDEIESITEKKVAEMLEKFPNMHEDVDFEEKVYYAWDGSNYRRIVLETDSCYDVDFEEDIEGIFDNLERIDFKKYNTGHWELLRNEEYCFLEHVSYYQGLPVTQFYEVFYDSGTIDEAYKSMFEKEMF